MWFNKIGQYTVERFEIPRPGGKPYIPMQRTRVGVLHTTEGSTVKGALAQLKMKFSGPHFVVGENRIVQCRPMGVQGAALHDPANREPYCQIEIVGFSKQQLWMPDEPALQPLVALLRFMNVEFDIPLVVPNDWPDDCVDMKGQIWAGNNSRRKAADAGLWGAKAGWWHHMEVPDQGPSWHWDCGAMRRSVILKMAAEQIPVAPVTVAPVVVPVRSFDDVAREFDLPALIASDYPWPGEFTQDAANVISLIGAIENCPRELMAVTWLNESKFNFFPQPNMNKQPDDGSRWDVGPGQLNIFWTRKVIAAGEAKALPEGDMFGGAILSPPPAIDRVMFTGNPVANLTMMARRLLAIKGTDEERAVKYTGPGAQPYRLESWRKYSPRFKGFFEKYKPYRVGG